MADWTVQAEPLTADSVGPTSRPCEDGVESHQWRLVIDDGSTSFRSGCMSCEEFIEDMFPEAYVVADIPVTLTWESCGNPGGWHGLQRCDCDAYWIVNAEVA